jgi:Ca2+-binding RTX toxin-like protein
MAFRYDPTINYQTYDFSTVTIKDILGFDLVGEKPEWMPSKEYEDNGIDLATLPNYLIWLIPTMVKDNQFQNEDDWDQFIGQIAAKLLKFSDVINLADGDDVAYGYGGNDDIDGGDGNDDLYGGEGQDDLDGGYGTDQLFGEVDDDDVSGGGGNDEVDGGAGNDAVSGDAGNDVVNGGEGSDVISGGDGKDTLTGGAGQDFFVFNSNFKKSANVDRIKDFKVADDTIRLDNAVFKSLGLDGDLSAKAFVKNKSGKAADKFDRVIYETGTGKLFYDADGTGKGAAYHIATLSKNLAMSHADFVII